jgi:hypothetical protein
MIGSLLRGINSVSELEVTLGLTPAQAIVIASRVSMVCLPVLRVIVSVK